MLGMERGLRVGSVGLIRISLAWRYNYTIILDIRIFSFSFRRWDDLL
jgi:hypothetical protein